MKRYVKTFKDQGTLVSVEAFDRSLDSAENVQLNHYITFHFFAFFTIVIMITIKGFY